MAWGDDDGGDKKKGCFKCGEEGHKWKIREIYVPKEETDDSKLNGMLGVAMIGMKWVEGVPKERYVCRDLCIVLLHVKIYIYIGTLKF